jgi:hypothetical protein
MLSCIVIDFFLNNQEDATIIQNYSVIKLHVSGIFSARHQEFLLYIRQLFQIHPDSAWKRSSKTCMKLTSAECSSILTLLGSGHQKPA